MGGSGIPSAVGAAVGLSSRWEAGSMLQRACGAMSLGIALGERGDFIRAGYRRRRFSASLQKIWRTGGIQ